MAIIRGTLSGVDFLVAAAADPVVGPASPVGAATPPHHEAEGYVYFLRVGMRVKIGWSTNPDQRLKQLRTALPEIDAFIFVPGSRKDEKLLHRCFYKHRITGEWFVNTRAVKEAMVQSAIYGRVIAIDDG